MIRTTVPLIVYDTNNIRSSTKPIALKRGAAGRLKRQGAGRESGDVGWLDRVAAAVQPAHVEERPRHLRAALAAGVSVIATAACGLAAQPGLTLVPANDPQALREALSVIKVASLVTGD
jgi:hypothetical protein